MPLTDLVITADCQRHGWLDRAAREACRQLAVQGRPQIAAHLARRFAQKPSLETLQGCLRMELTAGQSGALALHAPQATRGGDAPWHFGQVPLKPHITAIGRLAARGGNWTLPVGERVVTANNPQRTLYGFGQDDSGAWELDWHRSEKHSWRSAATDGTLLVAAAVPENGRLLLHGLDPQNGSTLWAGPAANHNIHAIDPDDLLLLVDGKVLIHDPVEGRINAYDARNGQPLWSHNTRKRQVELELRAVRDRLVVLERTEEFYALDLNDGHRLWRHPLSKGYEKTFCTPQHLYLSRRGSGLARYCLDTGKVSAANAELSDSLGGEVELVGIGLANDGQTLALADKGGLTAIRLDSAHGVLWQREADPTAGAEDVLIVGETLLRFRGGRLAAYDLQSGQPLWENLPVSPSGVRAAWGMPQGILVWADDYWLYLIQENAQL